MARDAQGHWGRVVAQPDLMYDKLTKALGRSRRESARLDASDGAWESRRREKFATSPASAFTKLAQYLRPGGVVALTEPFSVSTWFYFQVQLGMKFWPVVVSCFCSVPSESMDQI